MNIINKIKNSIFGLLENKFFRIILIIFFLIFIIKNYTSIPTNINNFKKKNNLKTFSINKIKNSMDTKIIKSKQEEIKNRENQKKQEQITKNIKVPNITKDSRIFIVDLILFDKNEKNILTEIKDMQVLVADDNNVFAKYLKDKKINEIVIIPITEIADQKLPETNIYYKLVIKNIKKLTE